jgi:hypothetical protein
VRVGGVHDRFIWPRQLNAKRTCEQVWVPEYVGINSALIRISKSKQAMILGLQKWIAGNVKDTSGWQHAALYTHLLRSAKVCPVGGISS